MDRDGIVDVVIVGGGPTGLSAALVLGRACKQVVLFDAGPPRNEAAEHVNGFFGRDGTPPTELRRIGREQLAPYGSVAVRDARVEAITPEDGGFTVRTATETVRARRVILAVGMIDDLPDLPGLRPLWGKSVFICPYCHGFEFRGRTLGVIPAAAAWIEHALFLKGWSHDLVLFTGGAFPIPDEVRAKLDRARIRVDERRITGLRGEGAGLAAVQLEGGEVACDALFLRPPQRQTPLVASLGLALDDMGCVRVDEMKRTSIPGLYAAGDLTTMMQGALVGAAAGAQAAYMLNHELTVERVLAGEL